MEAWRKVVELHPGLARAHVKLASAIFDEASPQGTGYTSIATLEATRAALAELEVATGLGWDDLGTRGDMGFYRFLIGLQDPASGAPEQAVEEARAALELAPDLPVVRFNLGSALLAAGRIEEAEAAYGRAVEAVTATTPGGDRVFSEGERSDVSSGALTDIALVAAARADDPAITAAIPGIRTAIVRGMSDPAPAGAAASPARVSGLELVANPSEIWWQARIDDFDAERDTVSVVWLQEDPEVPGWHVLNRHSGPLRLGGSWRARPKVGSSCSSSRRAAALSGCSSRARRAASRAPAVSPRRRRVRVRPSHASPLAGAFRATSRKSESATATWPVRSRV